MSSKTGIEWTDSTWNPIRGCTRVSEGCRNCYAEKVAYRFSGEGQPYEGLAVLKNGHASWTGKIQFVEKHLLDPLKWKQSRRIFVNSMSDLFHENVTDEMRDKIFAVMGHCSVKWNRCTKRDCDHDFCDENHLRPMTPHIFQVLTKRPEAMFAYLSSPGRWDAIREAWDTIGWYFSNPPIEDAVWPLPNVWLGVSVENQAAADERIPLLLQTPAAVRFISAEPLLEPVSLEYLPSASGIGRHLDALSNGGVDSGALIPSKLDWVICGGESGPGARPMHPDWARSLRDQCQAAGVPFFFKQWGEWGPLEQNRGLGWRVGDPRTGFWSKDAPGLYEWHHRGVASHGEHMLMVGKHAAGAQLDGREWKQFPGDAHA